MKKNSLHTYGRMISFLQPYIGLFIAATAISFVVVSLDGISIWFISTLPKILFSPEHQSLVKPVFSFNNINEWMKYWSYSFINSQSVLKPLTMVCIMTVMAYAAKNVLGYLSNLLLVFVNLSISRDMRNAFYRHVLNLPVSFYDRNKTGSVISLLVNDLNQINVSITGAVKSLVMEPLRLVFFIGLLLVINWKLTLIVFTIYPVLGLIIGKIGSSVRRRIHRELESYSGFINILSETINGVRAVKMFNTNDIENSRFQRENNNWRRKAFKSTMTRDLLGPLTEILIIGMTASLLWYGGRQTQMGTAGFTSEDFFRYLFFLFSSWQPFKALGNVNNMIQAGIAAGKRVFALLDLPGEPLRQNEKPVVPRFEQSVDFKDVKFTYPQTETEVLRGITFTARKGEIIAIVGSSGAGKSTILDLLPRFYDLNGGSISIDGVNIQDIDLAGLRSLFGIVAQETILFDDTVKGNIAYGRPDATEQEVREAAAAANAMEFIEKMPDGLNTVIGERGVMLSGGQRQRLSIARALLRNPQILILDEATSSLDTESERLVQDAIDRLVNNRTCFVVAHRLSTVIHADRIIVLDKGVIVEEGTHTDLLVKSGRYRQLHDMQFRNPK